MNGNFVDFRLVNLMEVRDRKRKHRKEKLEEINGKEGTKKKKKVVVSGKPEKRSDSVCFIFYL